VSTSIRSLSFGIYEFGEQGRPKTSYMDLFLFSEISEADISGLRKQGVAPTTARKMQKKLKLRTTRGSEIGMTNTAQHHSTITHLVLDLLHRLELFYGKQQTSRRNEMIVIA